VRGFKAVSCAATLKALGLNILRSSRLSYASKVAFEEDSRSSTKLSAG